MRSDPSSNEGPPAGLTGGPTSPDARRVLLVNPNRCEQPYPVYPLGLAYLQRALRAFGCATATWDALAAADTLESRIRSFAPTAVALSMRNVDNVQAHNARSFVGELLDTCRRIRDATKAPLILGGSGFSLFPRELFELTGADYGIQGEGEASLVRLLEALESAGPLESLPGLVHRGADGRTRVNPPVPGRPSFDAEPEHDAQVLRAYAGRGSLPGVQTQRGCPLRCCYCTYPLIEGTRSRYRSADHIVREMGRLVELGVKYTFVVDSVFNTNAEHVARICEALVAARLGMEWQCFLRPRNLSRKLLELMKRAGLRHIEFGSDSLSDPVLKRYGKGFTYEEILGASTAARELGIKFSHFLIFGGPGETPETVEETLSRAQGISGSLYFASIGMRIYPGTPLWREVAPEERGQTPSDYLATPRFHLERPFTVEDLYGRLQRHRERHHNWVVGDPSPEFLETMEKLRARGVRGPMWEYIETLQRVAGSPSGGGGK